MSNYVFGKKQPPHKRWAVAWYNPFVLYRSVKEMISTNDQIRNLDRREMYSPDLKLIQIAEEQRDGDFWWDFVSDTGDGGNATFTVAREIQKDFIEFDSTKQNGRIRSRILIKTTQLQRLQKKEDLAKIEPEKNTSQQEF